MHLCDKTDEFVCCSAVPALADSIYNLAELQESFSSISTGAAGGSMCMFNGRLGMGNIYSLNSQTKTMIRD